MFSSSLSFPPWPIKKTSNRGFSCRAENPQITGFDSQEQTTKKKQKVLVVGSGWAGLGAAHHLCKQGFDVTVLEGIESGLSTVPYCPDEIGIQGFWYPYRNIFNIIDELDLKPFTSWMRCAQYSEQGIELEDAHISESTKFIEIDLVKVACACISLRFPEINFEVEFPVFQDQPQLPTPLGTLSYSQFTRLPLFDRLIALPLMAAVIDFDNTDTAWRKYDPITARELFRQFGCSERLYRDILDPLLEVRLFAPAEQCSAAATLSILYYYVLAHQKNFDAVYCRGTVRDKIFEPWKELLRSKGCKFRKGRAVTDFFFNEETGCISEVICGNDRVKADAVILAVGISTLQEVIKRSSALCTREEFLKVLNLSGIDSLSVKLRMDRKVNIPKACNACCGFDELTGWAFFDLNAIYDEYEDESATIVQAEFYYASQFLPLSDELVVEKVMAYLSRCVDEFKDAKVIDKDIRRYQQSLAHFFPGSYKYMMRTSTSFPNLFMAGDWIINRHGSWAQEKAYVTGLEAANRVVDYLEEGSFAKIIPVEEDEPHVQALRDLNRNFDEIRSQLPWSGYFIE